MRFCQSLTIFANLICMNSWEKRGRNDWATFYVDGKLALKIANKQKGSTPSLSATSSLWMFNNNLKFSFIITVLPHPPLSLSVGDCGFFCRLVNIVTRSRYNLFFLLQLTQIHSRAAKHCESNTNTPTPTPRQPGLKLSV